MYEEHFGFREPPFRITPDPRFLYRNPCVEEAAAALAYGIERRKGFLSLVGEAGTGKTTLLRHVLDTLAGNVRTVVLLHPTVEFDEILEYIMSELGVPTNGARKLVLLQRLHEFLVEHTRAGGNVALLIDEAQDLETRVLEELRLLSNLETGTEKILQIVLAGQPELETKLADQSLRQLRQRIALHIRLRPLSPDEVAAYIRTRLELAGATRTDVFTPDAAARIAAVSTGIPRVVNVLCDACLVTAYAMNQREVTPKIVDEAWVDYSRLVGDLPPAPSGGTAAARPNELPPEYVPRAPEPRPEPPRVEPAPGVETPPRVDAPPPMAAPVPTPEPEPAVRHPGTAGPAPTPAVAPAPDAAPQATAAVPPPVRQEPHAEETRSPWWAGARLVTIGVLIALVAMASLNFSLRRNAPIGAEHPIPVTALAQLPVVTADEDPLVTVPTGAEARALVHEFLIAYEARDAVRLADLFATDGVENDNQGTAAIRSDYERTFADLSDVTIDVPHIDSQLHGERLTITGPIVMAYRQRSGESGELRGTAQWEIARKNGTPRILRLRHDIPRS